MGFVRISVSLPRETFSELSNNIEPRKRSRFITEALQRSLKEHRNRRLAAEYKEATAEIQRINKELEGAISDGLD